MPLSDLERSVCDSIAHGRDELVELASALIAFDTTAREAYQHGYNQVFAEDAMNALSEEEHYYACTRIFPRMGRLRSTDEIVAALRATEHVSSKDNT